DVDGPGPHATAPNAGQAPAGDDIRRAQDLDCPIRLTEEQPSMFATSSWIGRLKSGFRSDQTGGRTGRATTRRRTARGLSLEHLEDRRGLSGYSVTDLGSLGGALSIPFAINGRGAVVGLSYTAQNAAGHAFLASRGTMTDLGTLGGPSAEALGINARGDVVGISTTGAGGTQGAIFLSR